MKGWRFPLNLFLGQVHTSPCVRKLAISAPFTAFFISQSEKMISGDLPPSSKVTGLIPLADISMILQNKNKSIQKSTTNEITCYVNKILTLQSHLELCMTCSLVLSILCPLST